MNFQSGAKESAEESLQKKSKEQQKEFEKLSLVTGAVFNFSFPKHLSLQEGLDELQNTFDQHYSIGFCSCSSPKVEIFEDGTSVCSECTFDIKIK